MEQKTSCKKCKCGELLIRDYYQNSSRWNFYWCVAAGSASKEPPQGCFYNKIGSVWFVLARANLVFIWSRGWCLVGGICGGVEWAGVDLVCGWAVSVHGCLVSGVRSGLGWAGLWGKCMCEWKLNTKQLSFFLHSEQEMARNCPNNFRVKVWLCNNYQCYNTLVCTICLTALFGHFLKV